LLLFRSFGAVFKHKLFFTKQPLATIFYSLPIIAENFIKLLPQSFSLTFTAIFSLSYKKQKAEMGAIFIAIRGSGKPVQ
jgi:hypothetical protein